MSYPVDYHALGMQIRVHRRMLHLTQEKLAEAVDLSVQYIGNIERGISKPSLETIVAISCALQTSLDQLLCDSLPDYGMHREVPGRLRSVSILRNTLSSWILGDEDESDGTDLSAPVDLSKLPPIGFMGLGEEFPDSQP